MKTRTHPKDYVRQYKIVDQQERICLDCGGWMMLYPDNLWKCWYCGGEQFVIVWGSQVEDWRAQIRMAHELAKYYAPQMTEFREAVALVYDVDEGSDNRMSTQMREHLDY